MRGIQPKERNLLFSASRLFQPLYCLPQMRGGETVEVEMVGCGARLDEENDIFLYMHMGPDANASCRGTGG